MTRTFIQTREFSSNWDRLVFNDDDCVTRTKFNIGGTYNE